MHLQVGRLVEDSPQKTILEQLVEETGQSSLEDLHGLCVLQQLQRELPHSISDRTSFGPEDGHHLLWTRSLGVTCNFKRDVKAAAEASEEPEM